MQRIDKQFLKAATLFTIFAFIGYHVLSFIAQRHIASTTTSSTALQKAPLVFIDTIQSYWWFGYLLLLAILVLKWIIKRVMS